MRTAIIEKPVKSIYILPGEMLTREYIVRDTACERKHCFRSSSTIPFSCTGLFDGCARELEEPEPEASVSLYWSGACREVTA